MARSWSNRSKSRCVVAAALGQFGIIDGFHPLRGQGLIAAFRQRSQNGDASRSPSLLSLAKPVGVPPSPPGGIWRSGNLS